MNEDNLENMKKLEGYKIVWDPHILFLFSNYILLSKYGFQFTFLHSHFLNTQVNTPLMYRHVYYKYLRKYYHLKIVNQYNHQNNAV